MRGLGLMCLSVEPHIQTRPYEPSLLEDGRDLFVVRIDQGIAEGRDELVEVRGSLTRLDRIGFGPRCIRGREEPLLDRDGIITTTAGDEPGHCPSHEESGREAHRW